MNRIDALLARAKTSTGLDDFGEDGFLEGLERLIASVDAEARLTETGEAIFDKQVVDLLSNRLQVEHWHARHPEIGEQEITAPLFGLGLPRTGSTALACLLSEDPAVRSLRTWESLNPCPPPDAATLAGDPRLAKAQEAMERRARLFPRMTGMLPTTATSPTECQNFMAYEFKSQIFQSFAHIPSYVEWLNHTADMVPTYRYVKKVLKLLQWRCPPDRWRLKNPTHSLFIGALIEVFPDARFVMTHRDVVGVIPSVADLYLELHRSSSDHVDRIGLGRITADFCELAMRRMIAFRDAGHEDRFFDIHFRPFQEDPFPSIQKLYGFLGEELTDAARARMAAWRRDTPFNENAYARTDMADFGLNAGQLRERFAFYSERFKIPSSAQPAPNGDTLQQVR